MRRRNRQSLVWLVLAASIAATAVGARGGTPYDPSLFVSPYAAGRACTRSAPCSSFEQAYLVARPGQVVQVADGRYPPQRIPVDPSKRSSADVVFQPAPGATVTIGCPSDGVSCLDILGDHVTIRDMHVAYMPPVNGYAWQGTVDTERGSDDVTLIGIDAGSLNAVASNMTVRGGDWGPSIDPHNMRIDDQCVNCTWDGLKIHDFAVAQGGHMECLTFEGGTNVTIRNSEFRSCAIFSIFAKPGGRINGALIENNVFWNPRRFDLANDIRFTNGGGGTCSRIVIRYNVIGDNISEDCGPMAVVGNIQLASQSGCGAGWDYNVFVDARPCGRHAVRVPGAGFVDAAAGNFHLRPGSPAIGRGSPRMFPHRDRDGQQRPIGALPDAGIDEAPTAAPRKRR
jgi:hypothetical protein